MGRSTQKKVKMSSTKYLLDSVEFNNIFKGSDFDDQLNRLINEKLCKIKFFSRVFIKVKDATVIVCLYETMWFYVDYKNEAVHMDMFSYTDQYIKDQNEGWQAYIIDRYDHRLLYIIYIILYIIYIYINLENLSSLVHI